MDREDETIPRGNLGFGQDLNLKIDPLGNAPADENRHMVRM